MSHLTFCIVALLDSHSSHHTNRTGISDIAFTVTWAGGVSGKVPTAHLYTLNW